MNASKSLSWLRHPIEDKQPAPTSSHANLLNYRGSNKNLTQAIQNILKPPSPTKRPLPKCCKQGTLLPSGVTN